MIGDRIIVITAELAQDIRRRGSGTAAQILQLVDDADEETHDLLALWLTAYGWRRTIAIDSSERWLSQAGDDHLPLIDAVAEQLGFALSPPQRSVAWRCTTCGSIYESPPPMHTDKRMPDALCAGDTFEQTAAS